MSDFLNEFEDLSGDELFIDSTTTKPKKIEKDCNITT